MAPQIVTLAAARIAHIAHVAHVAHVAQIAQIAHIAHIAHVAHIARIPLIARRLDESLSSQVTACPSLAGWPTSSTA